MSERPGAGDSGDTKKSGGVLKFVILIVIAVLVCAGAGASVYFFVLAPRVQEADTEQTESGEAADTIPETAVAIDLEEAQAAVVDTENAGKNSVLIYKVSIVCNNLETKELIEKNKQWFIAMLSELHSNRSRKDLQDAEFQKSILRQALEEGNSLLRRLQKKPDPDVRIFQMLYLKYAVFTLP